MATLGDFLLKMRAVDLATDEFRRAAKLQQAVWARIDNVILEYRVLALYDRFL